MCFIKLILKFKEEKEVFKEKKDLTANNFESFPMQKNKYCHNNVHLRFLWPVFLVSFIPGLSEKQEVLFKVSFSCILRYFL